MLGEFGESVADKEYVSMPDNKMKRGIRDRILIALTEPYEVSYFRRKHDLTLDQAKKIIEKNPKRVDANKAAERLKKR